MQSASAVFTPTFQAAIPDILPDEREYTEALSLSRLAYDLESLISPLLAASLLLLIDFHWLFGGTAVGFIVSALLVLSTVLPPVIYKEGKLGFWERTTRGIRTYLLTPRLRGLLALNMAAAAGGAMVIVNTVVYVRTALSGSEADVALALAVFGAGSMATALTLPKLLDRVADRAVMLIGGFGIVTALVIMCGLATFSYVEWWPLLLAWVLIGVSYSAVLTPSGRLLRRSSNDTNRAAVFAAQFALSHACWLVTYPLAGWLSAYAGWPTTFLAMATVGGIGVGLAIAVWPANDPEVIEHDHADLPAGHPHLIAGNIMGSGHRHAHRFVVDEYHPRWPEKI